MGSTQTKCSCGEFSKVEVLVTISSHRIDNHFLENMSLMFDYINEKSGYKEWTTDFAKYKAYPCEKCAEDIGDKLDEIDEVDYTMKKSKGYWKTDLP